MKFVFPWKNKKQKEIIKLRDSVTGELIESAYNNRKKEIESLRKYDRGEKQIIAPDLGAIM